MEKQSINRRKMLAEFNHRIRRATALGDWNEFNRLQDERLESITASIDSTIDTKESKVGGQGGLGD